jgi:hypothetical protein
MTIKNLSIISCILITGLIAACNQPAGNQTLIKTVKRTVTHPPVKEFDGEQARAKHHIDSVTADVRVLKVFVKLPGQKGFLIIKDGNFPIHVDTTYNLYRDKQGRILYAIQMPYCKTGDWFIAYKSYFDTTGKLYAFAREANLYNSDCAPGQGLAKEKMVKYYDKNFKVVDSAYTMVDENNKSLLGLTCKVKYDFPYTIIKNLKTYIKVNHLNGY